MPVDLHDYAEALRKNGLRQTYGKFFLHEGEGGSRKVVAACAVGQIAHNRLQQAVDVMYELNNIEFYNNCPESMCYTEPHRFGYLVTHLNDFHKWTFNRIADYLDDIANKVG